MPKNIKYDQKHLSTSQRMHIEKGLNDELSYTAIARKIEKHPSTIAKEVKKYRIFQIRESNPAHPLRCARFKECSLRFLCDKLNCVKVCKYCFDTRLQVPKCNTLCPEYIEPRCSTIAKAPYVCNNCAKVRTCNKNKAFYIAQAADVASQELLVSCRSGINQDPADIALLNDLISPLLRKGQSLGHIYAFHGHEIPCSRKTLYNYIDQGVFTARNIEMRRKVRYKCKPRKKGTRYCSLMLIFVLEEKTQEHVIEVFDLLYDKLGAETFKELFPIILTDNGSEFQFPARMECDENGEIRSKVFYCNPNCSWQKGMLEKNHEYIRYVIPKGQSLDPYDQT